MASETTSLTQLAEQILAAAKTIDGYLDSNNLPKPTFKADSPLGLPFVPEVQQAKVQLQDALDDLGALVAGPTEIFTLELTQNIHDMNVFNVANQFNFWDAVPLEGSVSYGEIASKAGIPEEVVARILRYGFSKRLFAETSPGSGQVVHTALSSAAVREKGTRNWLTHDLTEVWPGAAHYGDALKKWNDVVEPNKSGAAYAFFRDSEEIKSVFQWYTSPGNEWREGNFGQAMQFATQNPVFNLAAIPRMYDWESLGDFTFVDIGGSVGHITFMMASKFPTAKGIVQDLPGLEDSFNKAVPAELKSRVTFQPHDFFTPEPVKGAEIYFLKHILHDWSDQYAAKIIQQIVPALKENPKSRIMLCEGIIPPPGAAPRPVARMMSMLDLQMLTLINSKERTVDDWVKLFGLADEKLELKGVHQVPDCGFALIEVGLKA